VPASPKGRGNNNGAEVLSKRALNRALLARQLLLQRVAMPVADAIEHLVGMQAQQPNDPYYGLWTRLDGFDPHELSTHIEQRRAVRIALMRGTIHLVTARDALQLRPLMQPVLERQIRGSAWWRAVGDMDVEALAVAGRAVLEAEPRTNAQLGKALQERWPDRDANSMANAVRNFVPLVQVPPRGLWGKGGAPTSATVESWLGKPLAARPSLSKLVLRYLGAFGPGSVRDAQAWCGLTRLSEVFERLRPQLRTFRDEQGVELFDLPDAPRPGADISAPVRFLPDYDNIALGHADRSRIYDERLRERQAASVNGLMFGGVLVDGFIDAIWKISRVGRTATLRVEALRRVSKAERAALDDEGTRFLEFATPQASTREVRFETVER
jgi:hypothetical protein